MDRTASTLFYVDGPATLTLDHDPSIYSNTPLSGPVEFFEILTANFPDVFKFAAWGAYDSSGSFIYDNNGVELTGRRGFHMVFAVENATDIPQFGDLLFKHLWLKGFGYIHVSKDGKALPRTIFDTKVLEPQQPLFAGGAHCINCEQRRPDPGISRNSAGDPVCRTRVRHHQSLADRRDDGAASGSRSGARDAAVRRGASGV